MEKAPGRNLGNPSSNLGRSTIGRLVTTSLTYSLVEPLLIHSQRQKGHSMSLIEFTNWNGTKSIYLEKNKIAGCMENSPDDCTIFVHAGETNEEWKVHEPISSVRYKIDNG